MCLFVGNGTQLFVDINNTRLHRSTATEFLSRKAGKYNTIIEVYVHPENADGKYVINSSYGPLMDGGNLPAIILLLKQY